MLGAVVVDQLYEFFVLSLCPVALLNGRLFVLIELVLALRVVSAWNKAGNLDPVVFVQFPGRYVFALAVLFHSP